jgi:GH24 family phage-related lysozyme (muramidase)
MADMPMDNPDLAGHMMTQDFEGWEDQPYLDTKKNKTIGWGFNMSHPVVKKMLPGAMVKGRLDKNKAKEIFKVLYNNSKNDAIKYLGADTYNALSEGKRNVINDMSYNLGLKK